MDGSTETVGADEEPETRVTAHSATPERTVFTEEGNRDGWVATDLTVDLRE